MWYYIPSQALIFFTYLSHIFLTDEKDKQLCAPFVKAKPERSTQQDGHPALPDLHAIDANIASGHYESVIQFDADVNGVFSAVIREQGRMSTLGAVAVQLKKVIYKLANS